MPNATPDRPSSASRCQRRLFFFGFRRLSSDGIRGLEVRAMLDRSHSRKKDIVLNACQKKTPGIPEALMMEGRQQCEPQFQQRFCSCSPQERPVAALKCSTMFHGNVPG